MQSLLDTVHRQGIRLWVESDKLRFDAPKGAMTPALRAQLKHHKSALVALLGGKLESEPDCYPLSPAQQRLWLLEHWHGATTLNRIDCLVRLEPPFQHDALTAAFNLLIQRHELLRMRFCTVGDQPVQRLAPFEAITIPLTDVRDRDDAETFVLRAVAADKAQPYPLAGNPPFKLHLWQVDDDDVLLHLLIHHLVCDGWSMKLLLTELQQIYRDLRAARPPQLAPAPPRYVAIDAAYRAELSGPRGRADMAYWRTQLGEAHPPPRLPEEPQPDQPTAAERTRAGRTELILNAEQTQRLHDLARAGGATPFMFLLAVVKLWAGRLSQQTVVTIGTPISGRHDLGAESVVGLFLNMLALRTDLSGNPSFRELLARVRTTTLGAMQHQRTPFEQIVAELAPARTAKHPPFFDIMLNYITLPGKPLVDSGRPAPTLPENQPHYGLSFYADERNHILRIKLVFDPTRYSEKRSHTWRDQIATLLQQVLADPGRPIASYRLPPAIQHGPAPAPHEPGLLQRLMQAGTRHADTVVLEQGARQWTFAAVLARAQHWHDALAAHAVVPGEAVALPGVRGLDMIAAMLALWQRGALLLGLDPDTPPARNAELVRLAGARFIIDLGAATLPPDLVPIRRGVPPATAVTTPPKTWPAGAAYLVFTSGTTGTPKGIIGTDAGLGHFLTWQQQRFAVNQRDRVAQLTRFNVDVIFRDICLPLLAGACCVLPPADVYPDQAWLDQTRITIAHTVPSVAHAWLRTPAPPPLAHLRLLFLAGEAVGHTLTDIWRRHAPHTQIVNLYGASETNLAKVYHPVAADPRLANQPCGTPLPGMTVRLERDGRPCGVDEPGEIIIEGPFLSLGYLDGDGHVFVRYDAQRGAYRSGDLGSIDPAGRLHFHGRRDRMCKIRGVRVEPHEVEHQLTRHHDVAEAAVLVVDQGDGPTLVAHISPAELDPAVLRRHLAACLPSAFIPQHFITWPRLPLAPGGKVDSRALRHAPTPQAAPPAAVAPRYATETILAELFSAVLEQPVTDVNRDFFEAGGHSLRAMALLERVRRQFGHAPSLAQLFETPTVAGLAAHLRQPQATVPLAVRLRAGRDPHPLFFFHPNGGTIFCYQALAQRIDRDLPVYGIQAQGLDDARPPHDSIAAMAQAYAAEIRRIQPEGPYHLAGWSLGGRLAFATAHVLGAERIRLLLMIDSSAPGLEQLPAMDDDLDVLCGLLERHVVLDRDHLRRLSPDAQLDLILEQGQRAGVFQPEHGPTRIRRLLAVLRAHSAAARAYRPAPLRCDLHYIAAGIGFDDPAYLPAARQLAAWRPYIDGRVLSTEIAANHYTLLEAPQRDAVAAFINHALAQGVTP